MKNIFIIAGESSGDQHAAKYVKEHKKINPNINFTGIGQNALENEGVDLIFNSDQIAVVGIIEVISKYFLIKKAMKIATDYLKVNRPDLIILVDYVEFNLKIAEFAKKLKIDWKKFYDLSSLGSGSSKSLDRIAPQAIKNNYDSYFFTINNTIKDFKYMLKLFDGNKDMIKIIKSFLKPYIKEQKKLEHNALISHRLKINSY